MNPQQRDCADIKFVCYTITYCILLERDRTLWDNDTSELFWDEKNYSNTYIFIGLSWLNISRMGVLFTKDWFLIGFSIDKQEAKWCREPISRKRFNKLKGYDSFVPCRRWANYAQMQGNAFKTFSTIYFLLYIEIITQRSDSSRFNYTKLAVYRYFPMIIQFLSLIKLTAIIQDGTS